MARTLTGHVVARDTQGGLLQLAPGDTVPGHLSDKITNPKLFAEDDSEDEPEEGEPTDSYDDFSDEELIAELKDREITLEEGSRTRGDVIAALREDDAEE